MKVRAYEYEVEHRKANKVCHVTCEVEYRKNVPCHLFRQVLRSPKQQETLTLV